MNFTEIAKARQSCRSYDATKAVEQEKIDAVIEAGRLAPSACNAQPYHFTVCTGENAKKIACATMSMGLNKFADQAPVMIVISEKPYSRSAALGARVTKNDYRSIDIGIAAAYITAEATAQGLATCIIGWFEDKKLKEICGLNETVRLVITLGYPNEDDTLRPKKRKDPSELISYL